MTNSSLERSNRRANLMITSSNALFAPRNCMRSFFFPSCMGSFLLPVQKPDPWYSRAIRPDLFFRATGGRANPKRPRVLGRKKLNRKNRKDAYLFRPRTALTCVPSNFAKEHRCSQNVLRISAEYTELRQLFIIPRNSGSRIPSNFSTKTNRC